MNKVERKYDALKYLPQNHCRTLQTAQSSIPAGVMRSTW